MKALLSELCSNLLHVTYQEPPEEIEGRDLPVDLRREIEYYIATAGFALKDETRLIGVPDLHGARAQYRPGALYLDRRVFSGKRIRRDAFVYYIPYLLIFQPFCLTSTTISSKAGVCLAANALTIHAMAEQALPGGLLANHSSADQFIKLLSLSPASIITLLRNTCSAFKQSDDAMEILDVFNKQVALVTAQMATTQMEGIEPTFPVSPPLFQRIGMTDSAVGWMTERFGWRKDAQGNFVKPFLPLQTLTTAHAVVSSDYLDTSGLVMAPTSAGKTLASEARALARWCDTKRQRRKTVMLVPTKEIGVERAEQLREAYGYDTSRQKPGVRLRVCYSDGDYHREDWQIGKGDFDLVIMVNEKFRYFQQSSDFMDGVGEIVIDELEVVSQPGRGTYLELAIVGIRSAFPDVTILALSRPMNNPQPVVGLLSAKDRPAFIIEQKRRPVPIDIGLWNPDTRIATFYDCNDLTSFEQELDMKYPGNVFDVLHRLIMHFLSRTEEEKYANKRNNLVIASPTKNNNLKLAGFIKQLYEDEKPIREVIDENLNTRLLEARMTGLEPTQRKELLKELLPIGIGVHDADLTPEERRLISQAFRDREIPILICSQTMAYGINMPAQSIVFIDWGQRPPSPPHVTFEREPYVVKLAQDFTTWLGRVGRFGQQTHRKAQALYLTSSGPSTREYDTIKGLIANPDAPLRLTGHDMAAESETVLYGIRTAKAKKKASVTWEDISTFFNSIPSQGDGTDRAKIAVEVFDRVVDLGDLSYASPLRVLAEITQSRQPPSRDILRDLLKELLATIPEDRTELRAALTEAFRNAAAGWSGAGTKRLRTYTRHPLFKSLFLQNPEDEEALRFLKMSDDDLRSFETTRLGNVVVSFGVSTETVMSLARWARQQYKTMQPWDALDLLVMVRNTPDGLRIEPVRPRDTHYEFIRSEWSKHTEDVCSRFEEEYRSRSILTNTDEPNIHVLAMLLSLRDWMQGTWLYREPCDNPAEQNDIENRYGLNAHGSSVPRRARDFGRLLRVLAAVVKAVKPKDWEEERPEKPSLEDGVVFPIFDLEELSEQVIYGGPPDCADLLRSGIDGLARTWALNLYDVMNKKQFELDLPAIERLFLFSDDPEFRDALPTPGLAKRIKDDLNEKPRDPIHEDLRKNIADIRKFYSHPMVVLANVLQGQDRYTALKVAHRKTYTVFRRNEKRNQPIRITDEKSYFHWLNRTAVEFLAEVGIPEGDEYLSDRFLVDLDPANNYPLNDLKALAREIVDRFLLNNWVKYAYIHFTGGRGFHIIGEFESEFRMDVDHVNRVLKGIVARLCNDVSIFDTPQPEIDDPYVVIDLSPVKRRGVYRNTFCYNTGTGRITVPVSLSSLDVFDPDRHTKPEYILSLLDIMHKEDAAILEYYEFLDIFDQITTPVPETG